MKLTGERKLLLIAGGILTIIVLLAAFFAPDSELEEPTLSTYSSRSGGAKATYTFIADLGYEIDRWDRAPDDLPVEADETLFILAQPQRFLTDSEKSALAGYVERGGTLIIAGRFTDTAFSGLHPRYGMPSNAWKTFRAMAPTAWNQGSSEITMPSGAHWPTTGDKIPLYGEEDDAVAVTYASGKGRVIWLASQVPLSNAGLKAKGNAEFLASAIATSGVKKVMWDVYFSTDSAGTRSSLYTPPVLTIGAQLLFIFSLVLWSRARRSGPLTVPVDDSRLSQLEFVHTLGSLYQSAKAANIAIDIAYSRFLFLVRKRLGIPSSAGTEQVALAISTRLGNDAAEVKRTLERAESARYLHEYRPNEAAGSMSALRQYLIDLKIIRTSSEENR